MTDSHISTKGNVYLSYVLQALFSFFAVLASRWMVINDYFTFDFNNLLIFPWRTYGSLGLVILLAFLVLRTGIWQNQFVQNRNISTGFRIFSILSIHGMISMILFFIPMSYQALWVGLGLASFALALDLYANPSSKSISWLMLWSVILSAGLTAVLFESYVNKDYSQRLGLINDMYNKIDHNAVEDLLDVQFSLNKEGYIRQFLSVPQPFKIHRKEFNQVNNPILDPLNENQYDYIFNAYNRDGESMIDESYTALSYYNQFIKQSDTIGHTVFFHPIKNAYLVTWSLKVEHDSLSPYQIYLEQYPQGAHINSYKKLGTYDYAYYKGDKLAGNSNPFILSSRDLDYEILLGESLQIKEDQYTHLFKRVDDNKLIKLSRKSAHLIKPISLFSFVFLYVALLLGLNSFIYRWWPKTPRIFTFFIGNRNSLKQKLQLSIISLIIFSFFVIGVVTIVYFQSLSTEYDKDLLKEKAYALALDIQARIGNMDAKEAVERLSLELAGMARDHHSEINIYNEHGTLRFSTVPKVYEKALHQNKIEPSILEAFAQNQENIMLDFESKFMGLDYQHAYFPIYFNTGKLACIVQNMQVPVVKTHSKVSDFVGTLLNIYVLLFLFSGALALMVSHSITHPLMKLGHRIKELRLGSKNEQLEWKSNDEIGQLVNNYNEMVGKLDDSAKMIAVTERDLAWREMAKQVAHEIKNPLTPMKLSIQYLKRAIDSNPEDTKDMVDRVSNTLIEQIDNLSEIAGAFSNFGKMPQASNDKVVLNEIVEAVHDLFRKRSDMEVRMYEPIDELYVFADRNALVRILNNLVKNAIQSIPTDRRGHIELKLYKNAKMAVIKISDNGMGIPEERREKVFLPNFTTKSSGTGLGLAICANMVESFNGKLYFYSVVNEGTDFYLEIPLMHVNDNFAQPERVEL